MRRDDVILIEKYLDDSLSKGEMIIVENRLKNDADFIELFHFLKDTQGAIKGIKKQEFIDVLERVEEEYHQNNVVNNNSANVFVQESKVFSNRTNTQNDKIINIKFFKRLAMVASLALVFGLSFIYVYNGILNSPMDADIAFVHELYENSDSQVIEKPVYENKINNLTGVSEVNKKLYEIPFIIINNEKYTHHYLYNDTLYLLGDFSGNISLYLDTLNTIILSSGLKNYSIELQKSNNIKELVENNSQLEKIPDYE